MFILWKNELEKRPGGEHSLPSYEQVFKNTLVAICEENKEQPTKMREVEDGQTGTLKKIIDFTSGSLFVKIGEKVEKENQIYCSVFFNDCPIFLKPISKFSQGQVIVLPFYGGDSLETLLLEDECRLSPGRKSMLQMMLRKTHDSFWSRNIIRSSVDVEKIIKYIEARVLPLQKEISSVDIDDRKFSVCELFSIPIIYIDNKIEKELPSLDKMIDKVMSIFNNMSRGCLTCIMGDFQPSNIIIRGEEFKVVDLSNGEKMGDLALDVGKFFNFINRFYLIADKRKTYNLAAPATVKGRSVVSFKQEHLVVRSIQRHNLLQVKLAEDLEENFVEFVVQQAGDYYFSDRLKLYKFIINLITIRRHLKIGVPFEMLLSTLVDSYEEIETKILNI